MNNYLTNIYRNVNSTLSDSKNWYESLTLILLLILTCTTAKAQIPNNLIQATALGVQNVASQNLEWFSVIDKANGSEVCEDLITRITDKNGENISEIASIVDDPERGFVYKADIIANPEEAWDSQLYIQSKYDIPEGTNFRISFWYKCTDFRSINTELHAMPGEYLAWGVLGTLEASTEWKQFSYEGEVLKTWDDDKDFKTIVLSLSTETDAATFYIDNVVFEVKTVNHDDSNDNLEWIPLIGKADGSERSENILAINPSYFDYADIIDDPERGSVYKADIYSDPTNSWDCQMFIKANEFIPEGKTIHISFMYKCTDTRSIETQAHANPTYYNHWQCLGMLEATTEWQKFSAEATVAPEWAQGEGFMTIAFNLSTTEKAATFFLDDVVFQVKSDSFSDSPISENQTPTPTAKFTNKALVLESTDPEAAIYYTDGIPFLSSWTLYKAPIPLTEDCNIYFYSTREDYKDSEIGVFEFKKSEYTVSNPSFSYDKANKLLTISCQTEGAEIRYTTDGSEPTASSGELYVSPIPIEKEINFIARAFKEGFFDSDLSYFKVDNPQLETPSASFGNRKLTLSSSIQEAQIFYLIEYSNYKTNWTLYENPLELEEDCTVKFYAHLEDYNDSEIELFKFILANYQVSKPSMSKDYCNRKITINHPESLPVKVTIDGITEVKDTPVTIDVTTSMTSITAVAVAADQSSYDSEAIREFIRFHKSPTFSYNGHTLAISVSKDDQIKSDAEVVCIFNDTVKGQNSVELPISAFGDVTAYVQSDEAFKSVPAEYTINFFNTGRIAGARKGSNLAEAFGEWGDKNDDYTYLRIMGEVKKEDLQFLATLPKLTTIHFDYSAITGENCENIFADTRIETLYLADVDFPESLLKGMPRLTTLIWGNNDVKMPGNLLTSAANPNILLWATKKENAPSNATNIVIFKDIEDGKAADPLETEIEGNAELISLHTDYPFQIHKPIHAKEISVVKDFSLPTQKGQTQGWESLTLPFTPDVITHETKGNLLPFKAWDSSKSDTKPFWLYKPSKNGLEEAESIVAFEPYIISMPNNPVYMDAYNLAGEVTFTAYDVDLRKQSSAVHVASWIEPYQLVATFMPVEESNVLSLNVHTTEDGDLIGSKFVAYDETLPFGAYVKNVGNRKEIPLFGDGNGVELPSIGSGSIKIDTPAPGTIRLSCGQKCTVAIYNATGIMLRIADLMPEEPVIIDNLTKGIYICNGVKVMVE